MHTTTSLVRATRTRALATTGALAIAGGLLVAGTTTAAHADAWSPQVEGVSPLGNLPFGARIAVEPDGDATAVWAVDVQGHKRIATAARSTGGVWSTPVYRSSASLDAFAPDIRVNADGDVVTWWRVIDDGKLELQVTTRIDGTWNTRFPAGNDVTVSDAAVDIDAGGDVFGAFSAGGGIDTFTWPAGGAVDTDILTFDTPHAMDLAVTPGGEATVLWASDGPEDQSHIKATTFDADSQLPVDTIDTDTLVGGLEVEVNAAGTAQAAYTIQNGGQGTFVMGVRRTAGTWEFADTVSFNGDNAAGATVGIDAQGNAVIAWTTQAGEAQVASRGPAAEFGTPQILTGQGLALAAKVVMNRAGDAAVQWRTNEPGIRFALRKRGAASFTSIPAMSGAPFTSDNRDLGIDDQGSVTATYGVKLNATTGVVLAKVYDVGGPRATMTKPVGARVNATGFGIAWSSVDRYGPVEGTQVRVRTAPWNGGFGTAKEAITDQTKSSATFAGLPGRSYCFTAKAYDFLGNTGAASAYRCTTTPVDDRSPQLTGTWTNAKGKAHYRGTVRVTSKKGATMKLTGVKVERLGLLVAKGKGYGSVAVYFNGVKLGTYSLASATGKVRQQIPVRNFGSVRTGTVLVKVVSATGKPVKIDGLHVQKHL